MKIKINSTHIRGNGNGNNNGKYFAMAKKLQNRGFKLSLIPLVMQPLDILCQKIPQAERGLAKKDFLEALETAMSKANSLDIGATGNVEFIGDSKDMTLSEMLGIVTDGGEVEGVDVYAKMPVSILDIMVPAGLPKQSETEGGVETIRTWGTWRDKNHPIKLSNDKTIAVFGLSTFGKKLPMSAVKIIADQTGYGIELMLEANFRALMQTAEFYIEDH